MNSMQMPSPAAGAGLGAMIQAKGTAGAGAPKKTMNEMMALADKLPDSELADVLSGKSVRVPQFAAMLAAMGRESLRKAVAGAQAGQAKEPSRKDQMLARMQPQAQPPMPPQAAAGLEALPAPNMETVSAAEGGIIGYSGAEGSSVEDPLASFSGNSPDAMAADRARIEEIRARRAAEEEEIRQRFLRQAAPQMAAPVTPPPAASAPTPETPAVTPPAGARPPVAQRAPAPAVQQPQMPERRTSAIDQLMAPTEDIAKQVASSKNQAQGEFLMQLGASLMKTQNLGVALGKGVEAGLPGLAANRKEINAIQKDQRDYKLNLSKAQEAAAQGKDDLAFKYADLAEKSQYHAGLVASRAGGGDTRLATAAMNKAQEQLKLAMADPRQRRNLGTPEAQQTFLNNAFQSNLSILSGQGPSTPSIPTYGAPPQGAVTRE